MFYFSTEPTGRTESADFSPKNGALPHSEPVLEGREGGREGYIYFNSILSSLKKVNSISKSFQNVLACFFFVFKEAEG